MNFNMTTKQIRDFLRGGKYAWPGCYPMYFITSDGAPLSFEAVKSEYRQVSWSVRNKVNDGWRVIGVDINWESEDLFCAHNSTQIESAY